MNCSYIKTLFLLFILYINILQVKSSKFSEFFAGTKYYIQVANNLPPGSILKVHCASKQTDIGFHDIVQNDQIAWSFRETIFTDTLFFCHFWWGQKDKAFEVFNTYTGCIKNSPLDAHTHICKWIVKADGFYLQGDPTVNPKFFNITPW
ncbi:hypothetical protein RND71_027075 [Anisodus tanguticus]|uniref:S-protein homolog n=1 Tax=Anisodus tanguticus TaxID=243964 RepID=A0AAE1V8V8_9SOLA|nr:hypothetical protein RND71_027075 [Anisodus tanguticus]